MKLADLRRIAIRTNLRIRFPLSNGQECVINEHGIAEVPELRAVPAFNLEEELAQAARFTLEPVAAEKAKGPQIMNREQLAAMAGARSAEAAADEHDE
jgi:hypothetical protein